MHDILVRHHDVPVSSLPPEAEPLRVVHLSDLHCHRWTSLLSRLQRRLLSLDYEILLMTGDFCDWPDNWRRTATVIRRLLEPVRPPLGCLAVTGNHDAVHLATQSEFRCVRFLLNESIRISVKGHPITIAGIDGGHRSVGDLPRTLSHCPRNGLTILMAHMPSVIHYLPDERIDLVLSGHTHAGQWRWPWGGSLTVNDRIERRHIHGLHRVGRRWLHVTAGVGCSPPFAFRLFCPPEIVVLNLISEPRSIKGSGT